MCTFSFAVKMSLRFFHLLLLRSMYSSPTFQFATFSRLKNNKILINYVRQTSFEWTFVKKKHNFSMRTLFTRAQWKVYVIDCNNTFGEQNHNFFLNSITEKMRCKSLPKIFHHFTQNESTQNWHVNRFAVVLRCSRYCVPSFFVAFFPVKSWTFRRAENIRFWRQIERWEALGKYKNKLFNDPRRLRRIVEGYFIFRKLMHAR